MGDTDEEFNHLQQEPNNYVINGTDIRGNEDLKKKKEEDAPNRILIPKGKKHHNVRKESRMKQNV